jgi:hypothetical protein
LSSAVVKFVRTSDVPWELAAVGLVFLVMGISSVFPVKQ